jgi:hypothetical protein
LPAVEKHGSSVDGGGRFDVKKSEPLLACDWCTLLPTEHALLIAKYNLALHMPTGCPSPSFHAILST